MIAADTSKCSIPMWGYIGGIVAEEINISVYSTRRDTTHKPERMLAEYRAGLIESGAWEFQPDKFETVMLFVEPKSAA